MYCKKCGKQIEDDSIFCPFCRTEIDKESTAHVKHIEQSKTVSSASGRYLVWICVAMEVVMTVLLFFAPVMWISGRGNFRQINLLRRITQIGAIGYGDSNIFIILSSISFFIAVIGLISGIIFSVKGYRTCAHWIGSGLAIIWGICIKIFCSNLNGYMCGILAMGAMMDGSDRVSASKGVTAIIVLAVLLLIITFFEIIVNKKMQSAKRTVWRDGSSVQQEKTSEQEINQQTGNEEEHLHIPKEL